MHNSNLSDSIKLLFKSKGIDLVGFSKIQNIKDFDYMNDWLKNGFHADMKYLENPRRQEPATSIDLSYESVISCAINYNLFDISKNSLNAKNKNMAWIARYAVIDDYHKVLKRLIDNLMQEISKVYKLNYKVYIDTGPLLERAYSKYAGIGWVGKNSCIINKDIGSFFFLAEILIDKPLIYDEPVKEMCGTCTRCIDSCPTNAIVEDKQIDSNKCISYLTIENKNIVDNNLASQISNNVYGCDICQEVCPWNRKVKIKENFNWNIRDYFISPDFNELLDLIENDWEEIKINSPLKRAKKQGLIRNILLAMANTKDIKYMKRIKYYLTNENQVLATTAKQAIFILDN